MTIEEFKDIVCDDGIAEVRETYAEDDVKREGAIEGFEIAREVHTREEFELILQERERHEAGLRRAEMLGEGSLDDYWYYRWATMQVEWVYQVMMAASWARPDDQVSARAALKAEEVAKAVMEGTR